MDSRDSSLVELLRREDGDIVRLRNPLSLAWREYEPPATRGVGRGDDDHRCEPRPDKLLERLGGHPRRTEVGEPRRLAHGGAA